jgi:predicted GIY-YIG superfamily endonuclease
LNKTGIYAIVNKVDGKAYVGSSENIRRRWVAHRSTLKNNKHHSQYLQNAWNKYGKESFVFVILSECRSSELVSEEQRYIDTWKPEYNICPVAGKTTTGRFVSYENRKKSSERMMGNKNGIGSIHVYTEDIIDNMSKAHKGNKHDEETKQKISQALKGKPSPLRGRKIPMETRIKMSIAHNGSKYRND